jgi:antitoxin component YwqK of YwqJK toxin-antitoxin module
MQLDDDYITYDKQGNKQGLYILYGMLGEPYIKGRYKHGKRINLWEQYKPDGDVETKIFYLR